jgi:hypothetical protein
VSECECDECNVCMCVLVRECARDVEFARSSRCDGDRLPIVSALFARCRYNFKKKSEHHFKSLFHDKVGRRA